MTRTLKKILCIGGCEKEVDEDKFGCPECWERLRSKQPQLAARIISTYREGKRVEHLLRMGDGRNWFRRNPIKPRTQRKAKDDLWL